MQTADELPLECREVIFYCTQLSRLLRSGILEAGVGRRDNVHGGSRPIHVLHASLRCSAFVPLFISAFPPVRLFALSCVLQVPVERLPREPPERRPFDLDAAVFLADFAFEAYRVIWLHYLIDTRPK